MAQLGYRQAPGQPNRMISPAGEIVTRASYRNAVARSYGYRNDLDRRGHAAGDEKYYRAWARTEQGQQALAQIANSPGKTEADLKRELIAARNTRPHAGRNGGAAYYEFMEEYDLYDVEDWIDY